MLEKLQLKIKPKRFLITGSIFLVFAWGIETFKIESLTKHIQFLKDRQQDYLANTSDSRLLGLINVMMDNNHDIDTIISTPDAYNVVLKLKAYNIFNMAAISYGMNQGMESLKTMQAIYDDSIYIFKYLDSIKGYNVAKKYYDNAQKNISGVADSAQDKVNITISNQKHYRSSFRYFSIFLFALGTVLISIDKVRDFIKKAKSKGPIFSAILRKSIFILGVSLISGAWFVQPVSIPKVNDEISFINDFRASVSYHLIENRILENWRATNEVAAQRRYKYDSLVPGSDALLLLMASNMATLENDAFILEYGPDSADIAIKYHDNERNRILASYKISSYSNFSAHYESYSDLISSKINKAQGESTEMVFGMTDRLECLKIISIIFVVLGTLCINWNKIIEYEKEST